MDKSQSAFYTTRQAAKLLKVALRTVQLWADSGILEVWKTEGGHRRISVESVEKMMRKPLPMAAESVHAPEPVFEPHLKIVVAEDDTVLLKLYRRHIDSWRLPIDVFTASSGLEALLLIGRESPDLLITDLAMPDMDGFQMIRALMATPLREGLEIVVVTGLDEHEIWRSGGLPSSVRIFPKPIPFARLKDVAEDMLDHQRALEV